MFVVAKTQKKNKVGQGYKTYLFAVLVWNGGMWLETVEGREKISLGFWIRIFQEKGISMPRTWSGCPGPLEHGTN